jgi:hypothetical protein
VCCVGRHAAGNFRFISASNTRTTARARASGAPAICRRATSERPDFLAVDQELDFIGSLQVGVILADI